jgi:hypothetical protein
MAKTIEGKSRLVCLAYQVLSKIDVVVAGKTDSELLAVLVEAFHQHAAEVADAELSQRPDPRLKRPLPEPWSYPCPQVADRRGVKLFVPGERNGSVCSAAVYRG